MINLVAATTALALQSGDFSYTINSSNTNTVTITGHIGFNSSLEIPSSISNRSVVAIGKLAFYFDPYITDISIPSSITNIAWGSFYSCANLTNITIPDNVTLLEGSAFRECSSLRDVTIGNGVMSISDLTFYACINLSDVTIGNSVKTIGDSAFSWCHSLTNVTIPDSVATIERGAFSSCINLYDLQFGKGLETIGPAAFRYCTNLNSIAIPANVTTIREEAFELCDNLTAVYFKGPCPVVWNDAFNVVGPVVVYYLPRTAYWTSTAGGWPTTPWNMQILSPSELNQFGITFPGPDNMTIIVEACTNLITSTWAPIQTNTMKNGSVEFRDIDTAKHPVRYYRILMP